jgi:hypothetical protein
MLAYVFWHRPKPGVDVADYEEAQRGFHVSLETPSASFRLAELPFRDGPGGYEDWYLVEDWAALGELNAQAVDATRAHPHDRIASLAADGWGGVYALARGVAEIPAGVEWLDKPRAESSREFIASLPHPALWRRELVLGPAPEFCGAGPESSDRERI